ncbi:MAG TPA: hypothetical protein VGG63_15755 [Steroidobacteraceae bacterium]|jgi:hypothetical protein
MPSTAAATDPLSHYEVLSALWAAACTARGTDLRGQSLVNFDVFNPMPDGLVVELGSKLRPAGIEHGLGQAGSGEPSRIDVADADAPVLAHQARGQLVQEVLATVRDLGVDGPRARLASGTLSNSQRPLVFSVQARRLDFLSGGERRQRLQAEVDADFACPMFSVFGHLELQIQVPAAAGILGKAAAEDPSLYRTAEPNPVPPPKQDHCIAIPANGAAGLKGDPSQGPSATPSRPLAAAIPGDDELLTDRLHGIRMQAEELAAAEGELDQIEVNVQPRE